MKALSAFFILPLALASLVFAEEAPVKKQEKDYFDSTVLLIDHEAGLLGVQLFNEETGKEEKRSFRVDPNDVFVSDSLRRNLEFTDIEVGDRVDIYSETDAAGEETVIDIVDYSRFETE
ncbi:MAG: hypothetical protein ACREH5_06895 [Candidatus Omnitrophota bacterium]